MSGPQPNTNIRAMFAALDGAQIPGGCEHCDAYQTTRIDGDGIVHMTVAHDDWCPWWTAERRRLAAQS